MIFINKNPEYFITVAQEKSISKAAEQLFISQPYLSRHIRYLEENLETELFDRTRKPLALTPAGEIYLNYLVSSQQMYEKLKLDLSAVRNDGQMRLRLGFSNWRAGTLLPDLLPIFTEKYPDVQLEFYEVPNNRLFRLIAEEKVDFVIMNTGDKIPENIISETVMYEKILLVGHRENPLTARFTEMSERGEIPDLRLLEDDRVIMLPPDAALAERVNNYLSREHITFKNTVLTTNAATALTLTAQNFGFCFVNETGRHAVPAADKLVFFDLNSEDLIYPLCVLYKKNSYLTPMVRSFINMMIAFYKNHYEQALYLK